MSEFNIIKQYFTKPAPQADLGVGDDAALLSIGAGLQLAVSADMLVAGTHYLHDCPPYFIGWKSLAVNVSDMAAMGAQPKWATLAIALPPHLAKNETWLSQFSEGFFACAKQFYVDLIGGDTTRTNQQDGLTIAVQMMGEVPKNTALRRDGAKVGDDIWVSGTLGKAAFALAKLQDKTDQFIYVGPMELETLLPSLQKPQPRIALGLALCGVATSCIDISDGLLADLGHILQRSQVGAQLYWPVIPHVQLVNGNFHAADLQKLTLAGGDDYELCFTAPPKAQKQILAISKQINLKLTHIGTIAKSPGLAVFDANKQLIKLDKLGFDHFD
jgi:thiamine-monophosphate kinase